MYALLRERLVAQDQCDDCNGQHNHCGGHPQKGRAVSSYKAAAKHLWNIFRILDNSGLYAEVNGNKY